MYVCFFKNYVSCIETLNIKLDLLLLCQLQKNLGHKITSIIMSIAGKPGVQNEMQINMENKINFVLMSNAGKPGMKIILVW